MSEKTEKATPWKLQKAKEQGQVSKSVELTTCLLMLILLGVATALWPSSLLQLKQLITHLFYLTGRLPFSVDTINALQQFLLSQLLLIWLPFAIAGMLTIIVSTIAQTGLIWSAKPLSPDFKRLDLVKGFKRLFSSKLLFDAGKNSIKLSLVFVLIYFSIKHEIPGLFHFMKTNPTHIPSLSIRLLSKISLQLLILLFFMAMIDKFYTRWKFAKEQRMSKQDLKDEYKQREGDPKIKSKIKLLQHQLRQKTASLEQIKTADVVITNPTHLAIVLKYDRGLMPAPKIVCKAQGELVKQVKALAKRHHVPIVENKPLARILFTTSELNQWVNREHFPMVASIFREIYRQKAQS